MKKKKNLKYKFIKKYGVDLWGFLTTCSNGKKHFVSKMFEMFCFKYRKKIWLLRSLFWITRKSFNYSIYILPKIRRKSYHKTYIQNLRTLLIFRSYYGDMTIKKFRRYLQKVNKRRLDFMSRLGILLEGRLDILLYRLNFVRKPQDARQYIRTKGVKVNGKIVKWLNYQLYLNDVIYLNWEDSEEFYDILYKNLKKKNIIFNYPRYLEVNYKLMKCIFLKYPQRKDIPSLFKLDFSFLRNFI